MQSLQPRPPKKIVTKRQYLARLGDKAGTSFFGLIMLFFCGVGLLTASAIIVMLLYVGATSPADILFLALVAAFMGAGSLYLGYLGRRTLKEARQIDTGIPLTRSNIGNLPAEDSLVRASNQPLLLPETILLRAASETDETPPEQLLRPS